MTVAALVFGCGVGAAGAASEYGTVVVEQRAADGSGITGGCYGAWRVWPSGVEEFWSHSCDSQDDLGPDGFVRLQDLPPGTYRIEETIAPTAYKLNTESANLIVAAGETDTLVRAHQPLPQLLVKTVDPSGAPIAGSCWNVHNPGEYEGVVASACDSADGSNDGTTRFKTITPESYELVHLSAPAGYTKIGEPYAFTKEDDELTLTFTLGSANRAPVAQDDIVLGGEDIPLEANVLANDSDADGDALTVKITSQLGSGTATVTPAGRISYVPAPNVNGNVTIGYQVSDGKGGVASAFLRITLFPINDAPLANDDTASGAIDQRMIVKVLANDYDADVDALRPLIETQPAHGVASLVGDGTIAYEPEPGYVGVDSFTYRVFDGTVWSAVATVTVETYHAEYACTIVGGPSHDVIHATPGADVICGLSGNDVIFGYGGNDRIYGGGGNDVVDGGAGDDRLYGEDGHDTIRGGEGDDTLVGDTPSIKPIGFRDQLDGGAGTNFLWCGAGYDGWRNATVFHRYECEYEWDGN